MTKQDQRAKIEKLIENHLKATDPLGSDPQFMVSPVVHPDLAAGNGKPKAGAKKSAKKAAAKKPAAKKAAAKPAAKKAAAKPAPKKAAPKRKPTAWMTALKAYNSDKDRWCIPKKGSPEYREVKALMPLMAQPTEGEAPKPKKAAAKKSAAPKAKSAAKKAAAKRPLSEWQQFVKKNMKKGTNLKELSERYKKDRQEPMAAAADGGVVIGGTVIGGVNNMEAIEPNLTNYIAARGGGGLKPSTENFQRPRITALMPNRYTSVNNDTRSAITQLWDDKSYEIDYHV